MSSLHLYFKIGIERLEEIFETVKKIDDERLIEIYDFSF